MCPICGQDHLIDNPCNKKEDITGISIDIFKLWSWLKKLKKKQNKQDT